MRRVRCFGGPLDGRRFELDDSMTVIQAPVPFSYQEYIFDATAEEVGYNPPKVVTYTMHRYAIRAPHPCVRGAELHAAWDFLASEQPKTRAHQFVISMQFLADPPHTGWIRHADLTRGAPWWWAPESSVHKARAVLSPRPLIMGG